LKAGEVPRFFDNVLMGRASEAVSQARTEMLLLASHPGQGNIANMWAKMADYRFVFVDAAEVCMVGTAQEGGRGRCEGQVLRCRWTAGCLLGGQGYIFAPQMSACYVGGTSQALCDKLHAFASQALPSVPVPAWSYGKPVALDSLKKVTDTYMTALEPKRKLQLSAVPATVKDSIGSFAQSLKQVCAGSRGASATYLGAHMLTIHQWLICHAG
jgi:hypothetical protein